MAGGVGSEVSPDLGRARGAASGSPLLFISYASEDAPVAVELRDYLRDSGYRTWIAPDDIRGTSPWADQILEAITDSDVLLVAISTRSMVSSHVSREVNLALDQGKAVLPIRIEECLLSGTLKYLLALVQWVDAFPAPLDLHWEQLSQRITDALTERPTPTEHYLPPNSQSPPHNLPAQLTSFIGRTHELAELANLIGEARLLTLTGAGGSGKTRLALEAGRAALSEFSDGVRLIELAPLSSANLVVPAVADSLGVQAEQGAPLLETLSQYLQRRQMLFILDNCEHLLQAVAKTVRVLLESCPDLRVLATSRQRLAIPGEVAYPVRPLATPGGNGLNIQHLLGVEAVALFVNRAEAARPGFRLTNENASDVGAICRQLDGIPLAIELAAARLGSLSPQQVATHLDERFRILASDDRTGLPHHQTLEATIDWSHRMLSPEEQMLFRRLCVFQSSFTLEAAQHVCDFPPLTTTESLHLLLALVEKSLVTVDHNRSGSRYRLLETIRQFGAGHLMTAGETDQSNQRHADYYLQLAEDAEADLQSAKQSEASQNLESEHDNLRQTLKWALDEQQTETAFRIAASLHIFWYGNSHTAEGRQWLSAVLGLPGPVAETLRAKVLHGAGVLASSQDDREEALAYLNEAVEIYRRTASVHQLELGDALLSLARFAHYQQADFDRAWRLYHEALEVIRPIDRWRVGRALGNLVYLALDKRDVEGAHAFSREQFEVARELGPLQLAIAFDAASAIQTYIGDFQSAVGNLHQAADNYEAARDDYRARIMRAQLALAHLDVGNVDAAAEVFIPNATVLIGNPEHQSLAGPVAELAVIRIGLDIGLHHLERAAILIGATMRMIDEGAYVGPLAKLLLRYSDATHTLLGPAAFETATSTGAAMTNGEVQIFIIESLMPRDSSS
jgi:predicted ATPase